MNSKEPKVGIVGGGLAGIYTAFLLSQHKIAFEIIEAKAHLGGRIYGESTSSEHYKIDLGPSWVFPHQHEIQRVINTLGLRLCDQYSAGDAMFQRTTHMPAEQLTGVAPPPMYRIVGGTTKLIDALLSRIDKHNIRLSSPVESLHYGERGWRITTESGGFSHLVLAAPPRVLVDKLYTQEPNNTDVERLFKTLNSKFKQTPTWMAAQAKFAITFDTPFWRDHGLSGQAFSHVGPMGEIHDASFEDNNGNEVFALFGFIGVPYQHRQQISQGEMTTACISQLRLLFGERISEYKLTYFKDWANDIYTASKLDQTQASAHPHINLQTEQKQLNAIQLYCVASEFSSTEAGYMEGAILAAQQAVSAIVSSTHVN